MKAKKMAVLVSRGPMETYPKVLWAHEIPVLESVHGNGTVKVDPEGEAFKFEELETIDESEYSRLARAYGNHPDRGISHVEFIFGHEREGKIEGFYSNLETNLKSFLAPGRQTVNVVKADELTMMDVSLLSAKGLKSKLDEFGVRYSQTEKTEELAAKLENAILELQVPVSSN